MLFVAMPRAFIGALLARPGRCWRWARRCCSIAAVFQLFDGLQAVATGVLRGLGETRIAMASTWSGHWLIGLPVGYGCASCSGLASAACGLACRPA